MLDAAERRHALLPLLLTLAIWSYSWIAMKQAMAYVGPFDFAAWRYLLGALVLFAAMALGRQSLRPPPLADTLWIGLCQTTAFQGLEQWALVDGGAGRVALLAYTMPFWTVLLAWPLLRERPSRRQWIGIGTAALGLACIIEPWRGLGGGRSTVLAIAGGAAWAAGTVLSKRLFRRTQVAPLSLTAWQMLAGGLVLGAIALAVPQRAPVWNATVLGTLAYSVLLASSLAWWLWLRVLERLPTAVASLSSLGVPVLTVLLAWPLMRERPSLAETIGIALVLAGLVAVSGMRLRRR